MTKQANPDPVPGCGEALSRLIDGELDAVGCRALFERLARDGEARRTWQLLNVACDAVRSNETAALHSADFVSRVSAALASEPVVLAPGAMPRRRVLLRRVAIPAAAVAAAAVVLAVVAVPQLRAPGSVQDQLARPEPTSVPPVQPITDIVRSEEFEAYLAAHREGATGPVTSRGADLVRPAAMMTTEPR